MCIYEPHAEKFEANQGQLCNCPDVCQETLYKPIISQTAYPSNGVSTSMVWNDQLEIPGAAFGELVL